MNIKNNKIKLNSPILKNTLKFLKLGLNISKKKEKKLIKKN